MSTASPYVDRFIRSNTTVALLALATYTITYSTVFWLINFTWAKLRTTTPGSHTLSERVLQQKGCTSRLQIRFARFGRHFGEARTRRRPSAGTGRLLTRDLFLVLILIYIYRILLYRYCIEWE